MGMGLRGEVREERAVEVFVVDGASVRAVPSSDRRGDDYVAGVNGLDEINGSIVLKGDLQAIGREKEKKGVG